MTLSSAFVQALSSARRRTFPLLVCVVLLVCVTDAAQARDIKLGGESKKDGGIPPNVVPLPTIVVAMRKDDGGWQHVKIDAWLVPKDTDTALLMFDKKSVIVRDARDRLPGQPFETLSSPHAAPPAVKKLLHEVAEKSLGRPWTGDVLIKNLLVY